MRLEILVSSIVLVLFAIIIESEMTAFGIFMSIVGLVAFFGIPIFLSRYVEEE